MSFNMSIQQPIPLTSKVKLYLERLQEIKDAGKRSVVKKVMKIKRKKEIKLVKILLIRIMEIHN